MLGNHRPASETPFKWFFAGEQMMPFSHLFMLISDDFWLKVLKIAKKGYLGFLLMFIKRDKLLINITIQSLKEYIYPHAFLKKRWGYCNRLRPSVRLSVRLSVRPSVCPSRYLLLNHWTKSNQIWCVCCSHEWGVQRHIFFGPRPLGPWGGAKRSNIIKYH